MDSFEFCTFRLSGKDSALGKSLDCLGATFHFKRNFSRFLTQKRLQLSRALQWNLQCYNNMPWAHRSREYFLDSWAGLFRTFSGFMLDMISRSGRPPHPRFHPTEGGIFDATVYWSPKNRSKTNPNQLQNSSERVSKKYHLEGRAFGKPFS